MKALHYMERTVRELEDAYLEEILGGYKRDGAGLEPKADRRTASRTPVPRVNTTRVSRGPVQPEAASSPAKSLECHAGVRASRYAESVADLAAHPEVFRCPSCNMLLNSPENQPALAARPARKDSKGQKKERV